MKADLVIRGGIVVDGNGGEPFVGDVAIRDGIILAVGPSPLDGVSSDRSCIAHLEPSMQRIRPPCWGGTLRGPQSCSVRVAYPRAFPRHNHRQGDRRKREACPAGLDGHTYPLRCAGQNFLIPMTITGTCPLSSELVPRVYMRPSR